MSGTREDWFPTSVWYFDLDDSESLNLQLKEAIEQERRRDPTGLQGRSNVLGWHSEDRLHGRDNFRDLVSLITAHVADVTHFLKWDARRVTPYISSCWAVVNDPLTSNSVHNHPHSVLSGVYYVQCDEGAGDLFFRDPRDAPAMMAMPVTEFTAWTFSQVSYQPLAGRLLLFPSWLDHGVEPNLSGRARMAISFNVGVRWCDQNLDVSPQ